LRFSHFSRRSDRLRDFLCKTGIFGTVVRIFGVAFVRAMDKTRLGSSQLQKLQAARMFIVVEYEQSTMEGVRLE